VAGVSMSRCPGAILEVIDSYLLVRRGAGVGVIQWRFN
jgi:hypothetical protein